METVVYGEREEQILDNVCRLGQVLLSDHFVNLRLFAVSPALLLKVVHKLFESQGTTFAIQF